MPTYEYKCSNGHAFEQFQRMSEEPVRVCPTCGASAERLLSSGAGLLFKGSGFYITDYRSDSYRKAAEADSGKPAKEASSGEGGAKKDAGGSGSGSGGSSSGGGAGGGSTSGGGTGGGGGSTAAGTPKAGNGD